MKFKLEKKLKLDSAFAALVQAEGDKEASLSPNWTQEHQEVFAAIEAYRKGVVAPVDWCGCSSLGRQEFGDKVYRFEVLVALILSAQTPDLKLGPVMKTLQAKFPDGMTPEAFLATDVDNIKACLQTIGMQNQKTKALMGTSAMCVELYGGDIPPTFETLQALPGVGPKIAALVMSNAWKENVAIGVDTHVHRIANRLGWVATRTPEHTMRALQLVMPRKLWGPVNPLLVGFGQTLCSAVNPGCATCPVKERCPKIGTKSRKK
ncbi:DNA glycosylase [Powellomyces hirtus]|nr:DNA glycosylase [Powellomyces hirtus]